MVKLTVTSLGDGTYLVRSLKGQFIKTFTELTKRESAKLLSNLARNANRRIRNIENNNLYSPAVKGLEKVANQSVINSMSYENGLHISTAGKSLDDLNNAIRVVQAFLSDETSTVQGAKNYKEDVENATGLDNVPERVMSAVWRTINKIKEVMPVIANYDKLIDRVMEYIEEEDFSNLATSNGEAEEYIDKISEEVANRIVSEFLDIFKRANK